MKGIVEIQNRHHFTHLNELETSWSLLEDNSVIQQGRLELDLAPLHTKIMTIPFKQPNLKPGAIYHLIISTALKRATLWAEAGYEIAFTEFEIPFTIPRARSIEKSNLPKLEIKRKKELIEIKGKDFTYKLDLAAGKLENLIFKGNSLISEGPELNVTRSPINNERSYWMDAEFDTWYEWGLDSLIHEVESYRTEKISDSEFQATFKILSYSFLIASIKFNNVFNYTFLGSGDVIINHLVNCDIELPARRPFLDIPWLQKLGLKFELAVGMDSIKWYGRGPFETYPDRKTGARIGLYAFSIQDINMPYILPQDFGNRTDVKWAAITNKNGIGLAVFSNKTMNVSMNPYSNLESTWYPFQLNRKAEVTLNIDHSVSGVGGTPISVRPKYRTYPNEYHYRIRLKPFTSKSTDPMELSKEQF